MKELKKVIQKNSRFNGTYISDSQVHFEDLCISIHHDEVCQWKVSDMHLPTMSRRTIISSSWYRVSVTNLNSGKTLMKFKVKIKGLNYQEAYDRAVETLIERLEDL